MTAVAPDVTLQEPLIQSLLGLYDDALDDQRRSTVALLRTPDDEDAQSRFYDGIGRLWRFQEMFEACNLMATPREIPVDELLKATGTRGGVLRDLLAHVVDNAIDTESEYAEQSDAKDPVVHARMIVALGELRERLP